MRRSLFALAFSGFLTASWAAQPTLLAQLWDLFSSWGPSAIDAGCGMDPNDRCRPAQQIDAGCGMDPFGCPQGS